MGIRDDGPSVRETGLVKLKSIHLCGTEACAQAVRSKRFLNRGLLMPVGHVRGPPDKVSVRVALKFSKRFVFAEVHVSIQRENDDSRNMKLSRALLGIRVAGGVVESPGPSDQR